VGEPADFVYSSQALHHLGVASALVVLTNVELLCKEMDTQWTRDDRGRLARVREPAGRPAPDLVVGVAEGGCCVAIGSEVSDQAAVELEVICREATPQSDSSHPPNAILQAQDLLRDACGPVDLSSGPCYVFPPNPSFESPATLVRSTDEDTSAAGDDIPPGSTWTRDEWRLLLAGELGPWASAVVGGLVVSVCYSSRLAADGAEAGVWTHSDFRGKGHAAAVSAAWASLVTASGRQPFYSTSADNLSSQRVAARLGLRPIGWLWKLARVVPTHLVDV
jgi:GNAT acetyltransferase